MRQLLALGIPVCLVFLAGCGGGDPKVTVADLDKVLQIFEETLKEKPAVADAKPKDDPKQPPAGGGTVGQTQLKEVKNDPKRTADFLNRFAKKLNAAKIVEEPIGVHMMTSGAIEGFVDKDKNMRKSGADEKTLFTIQIDTERSRVVASQTVEGSTYNRERPYHYRPFGGGFFMGYMLGNMMSRQSSHYSGAQAGLKPKFGQMQMSPKGYHSSAVSKARTAARARTGGSARSGGSRGFRGGK